jgi:8-amino-7-oxononanoate synthase
LRANIVYFNQQKNLGLKPMFVQSKSAIQSVIVPVMAKKKAIAKQLQDYGFDVKTISPTVPEGQERLRFCLQFTIRRNFKFLLSANFSFTRFA